MIRILVTGATGLLGPYLVREARRYGEVVKCGKRSGDKTVDLADYDRVKKLLQSCAPHWVIHAAGMTNVDACERSPEESYRNNELLVDNLSKAVSRQSRFLYISTDQVYPDVAGPHKEAAIGPVNQYGRSKLAGERLLVSRRDCTIARINIFGSSMTEGKKSLDDIFVDHFRKQKPITLYEDVLFSPLHMATASTIMLELLNKKIHGIFNVGSRHGMSKAEFGTTVARYFSLQTEKSTIGRSPNYKDRAPRPKDLRMDVTKLENCLDRRMPTLEEEIRKL